MQYQVIVSFFYLSFLSILFMNVLIIYRFCFAYTSILKFNIKNKYQLISISRFDLRSFLVILKTLNFLMCYLNRPKKYLNSGYFLYVLCPVLNHVNTNLCNCDCQTVNIYSTFYFIVHIFSMYICTSYMVVNNGTFNYQYHLYKVQSNMYICVFHTRPHYIVSSKFQHLKHN